MPRLRDWLGIAPYGGAPDYAELPNADYPRPFVDPNGPSYAMREFMPNFPMGYEIDPEMEESQWMHHPNSLYLPFAPQDTSLKMNELRNYMGAPRNNRRSDNMHMSSMESGMPTDRPYPGESYEAFMARMAAEGQGPAPVMDPRAAALAQMMGNPATNPANTYNMGRTTENFYDQPASMPAPGTRPIEEMMMDPNFGGDSDMADAYGFGGDAYANGLPGTEGPPTRMQLRNRMIMDPGYTHSMHPMGPQASEDDMEQNMMQDTYFGSTADGHTEGEYPPPENLGRIGPDGDGPKVNDTDNDSEPDGDADDTEGELNMVQEQIGKAGQTSDELTGDEQGDADYLDSVATDVFAGYREQEELDRLIRRFESKYGYTPELTGQEYSERDNAD